MILSRELGKRIWGGSTNTENGGGGVSSDYIAGLLAGYATESWVDEHYISIDFFSRLFQAHGTENGSEIDVMPNDLETTITSVESMFGFWTNLYISALGSNGAAPAGISLGMLTDVSISGTPSAGQVLTYDVVTQKWVNANAQAGATALANLTDVTLTSLQANQFIVYDATSSKWVNMDVKTINGQPIYGSGDISVGGGASGNYVPLSGGTMTGSLIINSFSYNNIGLLFRNLIPSERFNLSITAFSHNGDAYPDGLSINGYDGVSICTGSSTSRQERMRVTQDGYVGIGTQSPSYDVDISGTVRINASTDGHLLLYGSTSEWTLIRFKNQSHFFGWNDINYYYYLSHKIRLNGNFLITSFEDDYAIYFRNLMDVDRYNLSITAHDIANSGFRDGLSINAYSGIGFCTGASQTRQQRMVITYLGRIGINVDYPSELLHVNGNIYATGAITALSDARKKDITGEAEVSVEQIAHAPAVQFLWKDKERRKDGQQVGTLAQYWRTVLPEVVMDKGGELSMQYGVAALVSAIVTARKVVDHERRITELERENERLKKEVEQLRLN